MSNDNKEWNEKSLLAWNQWKAICSICGCSDEYRHILMMEVANAFKKKLHSVIGYQLDSLFSDDYKTNAAEEANAEQNILPSQSGMLPSDRSFYHSEDFDKNDIGDDKELEDAVSPEDTGEPQPDDEPDSDDEQSDSVDSVDGDKNPNDAMPKDVLPKDAKNQAQWSMAGRRFRVDWAHEFDCGIIEKTNSEKSPKNYKDHTWECISRSDDPPLKIIRGQLLGFVGVINEIAERFLRNNFRQIWENQSSLQSPMIDGDGDSGTLEDTIADDKPLWYDSALDQSDKDCLQNCFRNLFSNDNAAIFLVYLTGYSSLFAKKISIAIPELQKYVGLSSTSPIYDRLNNVIRPIVQRLSPECLQVMSVPGANDFLIFLMIEQIKPEKRASSLLQKVTDGMITQIREEMENE